MGQILEIVGYMWVQVKNPEEGVVSGMIVLITLKLALKVWELWVIHSKITQRFLYEDSEYGILDTSNCITEGMKNWICNHFFRELPGNARYGPEGVDTWLNMRIAYHRKESYSIKMYTN